MGFHYFVLGFFSAFAFLIGLVVVGGKKGHEYIQKRLEELKEEQAKNPKKQEALKLEPVKQVANVKMEIMASGQKNHSIKAKLSLTGTKLKIHVIDEKSEGGAVAEKPVAILNTANIQCKMENTVDPPPRMLHLTSDKPAEYPLFKDERDGQADWLRADVKFDTVRECERWFNVMHANQRTMEWKGHVKGLPSIDVFNVFLSRILFNLNNDPEFEQLISKKISKKLTTVKLPLSGTLKLNFLTVGKQIPFIDGVSFISYNSTSGEFAFDFNLSYGGGFELQLVAQLHLRNVALPPVIITVKIEKLEGNVHLSVGAPPSNKAWIGFHEAPKIQLNIKQEVHTGKQGGLLSHFVKAIPDLSDVITDVVKVKLFEDMILPNMDDIPLPDVKDTPPSSPALQALAAGAKTKPQTTFGPGGNQGTPVPDHAKPAGYPGTSATTTSTTTSVADVAVAATAAKKQEEQVGAPLKREDSKASQGTTSPASESHKTPPVAPADSPVKKKPAESESNSAPASRQALKADDDDGEEMKEVGSSSSLGHDAPASPAADSTSAEEKAQLAAMEQRAQQRSEAMKEAASTSRKNSDASFSRENSSTLPAGYPSSTTNRAAPAATSTTPAGYPSGTTTAPAASPYGASPYASQTNRPPVPAPAKPAGTASTPASAPASTVSPTKKPAEEEKKASDATKDSKPAGYPGTGATQQQQQQYTYSRAQPQWSNQTQPQWGK